jgi:hypothetical protein
MAILSNLTHFHHLCFYYRRIDNHCLWFSATRPQEILSSHVLHFVVAVLDYMI